MGGAWVGVGERVATAVTVAVSVAGGVKVGLLIGGMIVRQEESTQTRLESKKA
jgi:hypothetical protein